MNKKTHSKLLLAGTAAILLLGSAANARPSADAQIDRVDTSKDFTVYYDPNIPLDRQARQYAATGSFDPLKSIKNGLKGIGKTVVDGFSQITGVKIPANRNAADTGIQYAVADDGTAAYEEPLHTKVVKHLGHTMKKFTLGLKNFGDSRDYYQSGPSIPVGQPYVKESIFSLNNGGAASSQASQHQGYDSQVTQYTPQQPVDIYAESQPLEAQRAVRTPSSPSANQLFQLVPAPSNPGLFMLVPASGSSSSSSTGAAPGLPTGALFDAHGRHATTVSNQRSKPITSSAHQSHHHTHQHSQHHFSSPPVPKSSFKEPGVVSHSSSLHHSHHAPSSSSAQQTTQYSQYQSYPYQSQSQQPFYQDPYQTHYALGQDYEGQYPTGSAVGTDDFFGNGLEELTEGGRGLMDRMTRAISNLNDAFWAGLGYPSSRSSSDEPTQSQDYDDYYNYAAPQDFETQASYDHPYFTNFVDTDEWDYGHNEYGYYDRYGNWYYYPPYDYLNKYYTADSRNKYSSSSEYSATESNSVYSTSEYNKYYNDYEQSPLNEVTAPASKFARPTFTPSYEDPVYPTPSPDYKTVASDEESKEEKRSEEKPEKLENPYEYQAEDRIDVGSSETVYVSTEEITEEKLSQLQEESGEEEVSVEEEEEVSSPSSTPQKSQSENQKEDKSPSAASSIPEVQQQPESADQSSNQQKSVESSEESETVEESSEETDGESQTENPK